MSNPIEAILTKTAVDIRNATIETCLELLECSHDLTEAKRMLRRLKANDYPALQSRGNKFVFGDKQ